MANFFFKVSRWTFEGIARLPRSNWRQTALVGFAPITLFALIAVWAILLIFGFTLMGDALQVPFHLGQPHDFGNRLYFSGVTFFTLGYGDLVPSTPAGKFLAVLEAGMGFAFLALVISYVPVLYSAFSRREVTILLLDSKAGSDPTAAEILRRHAEADCMDQLHVLFREWEVFAGQLLENYLSYPVLAFYRSQHDDQSWLRSLTAVMDACAVAMTCLPEDAPWARQTRFQANATFKMARHLVVDFGYVLGTEPHTPPERLPEEQFAVICRELDHLGIRINTSPEAIEQLTEARRLYEPFAYGLAGRLIMELPHWMPEPHALDNWQTTAWDGKHF